MSDQASAYVSSETLDRWERRAEEMGMSLSGWIQAMVEAGNKKFTREMEPNETRDDLRRKRNELRTELSRARERIEYLEKQLHSTEREAIEEFLQNNPGASYQDIVQHIINTASGRVAYLLDSMEGEDITIDEDGRVFLR